VIDFDADIERDEQSSQRHFLRAPGNLFPGVMVDRTKDVYIITFHKTKNWEDEMPKSVRIPWRITAWVVLGLVLAVAPRTSDAADYSGKRVELVVSSSEGSGTDAFARIFQPFLEKYLPGKPTVIVANRPGGSGLVGSNWFDRNANDDGTTLLVTGGSLPVTFLFAGDKVKFDMVAWNPVVVAPFGTCYQARTELGVTGEDPVADIKALRDADDLKFGSKNATSSEVLAYLTFDFLGVKVQPVFGLESGESRQAIQRGELNLNQDSSVKCISERENLDQSGIKVFMTSGLADEDGNIVRDPLFPNMPHPGEVYQALNDAEPSGPQWEAIKFLINAKLINKGLFLPANASDDARQTYDTAMVAIFADPEFQELTKKEFAGYAQAFGVKAKQVVRNAVGMPPDTKKWLLDWIDTNLKEDS
jgi:putative tricarboxylic transport membrane protein